MLIKFFTAEGEDWQLELADDVLKWCLQLYPIRKQTPQLSLVEGHSNLAGEYCFCSNTIIIYAENNVLQKELIIPVRVLFLK